MKTEDVSGELTQGPGIWPLCYNNLILAHLTRNLLSPLNNYSSSPFRKQRENENTEISGISPFLRSWEYISLIMYIEIMMDIQKLDIYLVSNDDIFLHEDLLPAWELV